jgi:hypothetical protein
MRSAQLSAPLFLAAVLTASLALSKTKAPPADHPALTELTPLLTLHIDSKEVQAVAKKYDLQKGYKFDQGSFTARDEAFTLMYRRDRIESIILRAAPWSKSESDPGWTTYSKALPHDLKATDARQDVEKKLGQPTKPGGDRWSDGKFELWVHFGPKDASIEAIWISVASPKS